MGSYISPDTQGIYITKKVKNPSNRSFVITVGCIFTVTTTTTTTKAA